MFSPLPACLLPSSKLFAHLILSQVAGLPLIARRYRAFINGCIFFCFLPSPQTLIKTQPSWINLGEVQKQKYRPVCTHMGVTFPDPGWLISFILSVVLGACHRPGPALGLGWCWVRHLSAFKAHECAVGNREPGAESDNRVCCMFAKRGMQKTKRRGEKGKSPQGGEKRKEAILSFWNSLLSFTAAFTQCPPPPASIWPIPPMQLLTTCKRLQDLPRGNVYAAPSPPLAKPCVSFLPARPERTAGSAAPSAADRGETVGTSGGDLGNRGRNRRRRGQPFASRCPAGRRRLPHPSSPLYKRFSPPRPDPSPPRRPRAQRKSLGRGAGDGSGSWGFRELSLPRTLLPCREPRPSALNPGRILRAGMGSSRCAPSLHKQGAGSQGHERWQLCSYCWNCRRATLSLSWGFLEESRG